MNKSPYNPNDRKSIKELAHETEMKSLRKWVKKLDKVYIGVRNGKK